VHFEWSDLVTVLILVALEGVLSGDNALVLAVMVLPLPPDQQRKALRYGIIGAFALRTLATLLAVYLIGMKWVSLVGGAYLLILAYRHFTRHQTGEDGASAVPVVGFLGLSLFWTTVLKVELTDLVFAVDSILVAVGMTRGDPSKTWVIITGGILGIVMMRMLTLQVLALVKRYPKLIDGAYVVIAWVGFKLIWEYLHFKHLVPFEISKELGMGGVVLLFAGSFLYARARENKSYAPLEPVPLYAAGTRAEADPNEAPNEAPDEEEPVSQPRC
jgi:YkoY family integral membrane protein